MVRPRGAGGSRPGSAALRWELASLGLPAALGSELGGSAAHRKPGARGSDFHVTPFRRHQPTPYLGVKQELLHLGAAPELCQVQVGGCVQLSLLLCDRSHVVIDARDQDAAGGVCEASCRAHTGSKVAPPSRVRPQPSPAAGPRRLSGQQPASCLALVPNAEPLAAAPIPEVTFQGRRGQLQ